MAWLIGARCPGAAAAVQLKMTELAGVRHVTGREIPNRFHCMKRSDRSENCIGAPLSESPPQPSGNMEIINMYRVGSYLAARLSQIGLKHHFAVAGDFNLVLLGQPLTNKNLEQVYRSNELNCGYSAEGYAGICSTIPFNSEKPGVGIVPIHSIEHPSRRKEIVVSQNIEGKVGVRGAAFACGFLLTALVWPPPLPLRKQRTMRRSAVVLPCITGPLIREPPHTSRRCRLSSRRTFSDPTFPLE
jgi:thiamine pyrophosphate-dependent enzyme